jgi:putative transposase
MPAKNVIKEYESGGYYHIYNRGVDKAEIFRDDHDYKTFLSYLQLYLSLQGESLKGPPTRKLKNYFGEISLLCYCLMPNHFHLFVKQSSDHGIEHFMRSLSTKYVRYFNSHYHRLGPLFQGPYKAVRVTNENQFIYLSKYIHRNPFSLLSYKESPRRIDEYKYSSYGNYLHKFVQPWVVCENILERFSRSNSTLKYQSFIEQTTFDDGQIVAPIAIDLE